TWQLARRAGCDSLPERPLDEVDVGAEARHVAHKRAVEAAIGDASGGDAPRLDAGMARQEQRPREVIALGHDHEASPTEHVSRPRDRVPCPAAERIELD